MGLPCQYLDSVFKQPSSLKGRISFQKIQHISKNFENLVAVKLLTNPPIWTQGVSEKQCSYPPDKLNVSCRIKIIGISPVHFVPYDLRLNPCVAFRMTEITKDTFRFRLILKHLKAVKKPRNASVVIHVFQVGGNPSAPQGSSNAGSSKERKSSQPEARTGSDENWQINHKEILVWKKCIGKGSFGTVYKGYYHGSVAVKTLNVVKPSPEQIQAFRNEVGLLKRTR